MIETVMLDWRFGRLEVPAADRYIRQAVEITGEYSGAEIDLYQAILRPGDAAVDVGANVGVFSVAMGRAVGPEGRVLAFEPQPPVAAILARNLAGHGLGHVEVSRAIVSDGEGEGEFLEMRTLPAGRQMNFGGVSIRSRTYEAYGGLVPTPVRSIDGLMLERCDFIKIDVEGNEAAVVAGAAATLDSCRPVFSVECDRPDVAAPLVDQFLAAGYRLWRFRCFNMRVPNPKGASLDGHGRISILMLLAVPQERLDRLSTADRSALQAIDSRAAFDRLSEGIVKDRPV